MHAFHFFPLFFIFGGWRQKPDLHHVIMGRASAAAICVLEQARFKFIMHLDARNGEREETGAAGGRRERERDGGRERGGGRRDPPPREK